MSDALRLRNELSQVKSNVTADYQRTFDTMEVGVITNYKFIPSLQRYRYEWTRSNVVQSLSTVFGKWNNYAFYYNEEPKQFDPQSMQPTDPPDCNIGDKIVLFYKDATWFFTTANQAFGDIVHNLLDLINARYVTGQDYYILNEDTHGWEKGKETNNGQVVNNIARPFVIRVLMGQKYDYTQDVNYELFRDIYIDKNGRVTKVTQTTLKTGFETTQFPDF